MLKIDFRAMGCHMAAFVDNESSQAARALERTPGWFEDWEQALSRFRPESELCRLNAREGDVFQAGAVLYEVVKTALEAARASHELVVPTLLAPLEQAGYDRSFEKIGLPSNEQPVQPSRLAPLPWEEIRLDPNGKDIFLPRGMRLDLGGVAKGWAAHEACLRLGAFGPALVDAGGDIAISSGRMGGELWAVAVADPLQASGQLAVFGLERCGVATSGIDYRRWRTGGRWNHHIIDPRTLEPVQTDLISVTVVAADVIQAEMTAKAVLILGGKEGLEWLETHPDVSALLAYQDGRVEHAGAVADLFWGQPELG
jgi:FAD:protein FMN transferase